MITAESINLEGLNLKEMFPYSCLKFGNCDLMRKRDREFVERICKVNPYSCYLNREEGI